MILEMPQQMAFPRHQDAFVTIVFLILCLCPPTLFQRPGVGRAHKSL